VTLGHAQANRLQPQHAAEPVPASTRPAPAAPLSKPQPHPNASAKALPNRSSAKAGPKAADNAEGEWESF